MPAVAVVEFTEAVDAAPMLAKIPVAYEETTVAGKTCHKPAEQPNPWVCVVDEKTLAFAGDEKRLADALSATSDDVELAALLRAADEKNEIRYVVNMASVKGQIAQAKQQMPPQTPPQALKLLETIEKIKAITFTVDLDGPPSIKALVQTSDEASAGEVQAGIKEGLAQLPELVKMAAENAPSEGAGAGPMQMNPAQAAQMFQAAAEKIDEFLAIEQTGANVNLSVKFPPETGPLADKIVQAAGFFAMMAQSSPNN
jgi:hypothetical protein